ncbi:hypothetical protein [Kitasatospora sp. NPDC002040]|uniref:hypothetical protein n=1 Tax=Kitasatospora sp. NPDC002040 TaxID=3154661 RepID=UPI00332F5E81
MAGGESFRIDLDEVEAAAKMIQTMLDDLERPTADLLAVVGQIRPTAYGTDALGKSLTGATASVGGLTEHQQQVLDGIKKFLTNSSQVAENLHQMVQSYRAVDEASSAELRTVEGAGATPPPVDRSNAPRPTGVQLVDGPPAAPPVAPAAYDDPDRPTLEYNHADDEPDYVPVMF